MFFTNLRRLWRALHHDPTSGKDVIKFRPIAYRTVVWLIVTELLVLVQVFPVKLLFDALSHPVTRVYYGHLNGWSYLAVLMGITFVVYEAASWVQVRMDILRNSSAWLFWLMISDFGNRKQLSLGADWHVANSSAKKESVLSKNHKKVDNMIDNLIFDIVPLTFRIMFVAVGLFFIAWPIGVLAIVTIAWYYWLMGDSEKRIGPLRKDYRWWTKQIETRESELTSAAMVIKEQGMEDRMSAEYRDLLVEHWNLESKRHAKFRYIIWRQDHVINLSRVVFTGLAGLLCWQLGYSIGTAVLASAWVERIYANIWRYGQFQYILNEGLEALHELVDLFETEPTVKAPAQPRWPRRVQGRVELRDVTFRYPTGNRPALDSVNLRIEPGTTVALVGTSGGGKSTVGRLVARLYDPSQGQVLVDGVDLRQIDDLRYRKSILGIVPQEPGLLDRTVFENIAMGAPGASRAQVEEAARRASAHRFITELPQGYDTPVGDHGVALSGGQRQRVAIARALLRGSRVLLLDEPTSALDAESQLEIKQTLEELAASREYTIMVIAHRFSTIDMADLVVVMENGRISEVGTHAQLARRNGLYQRLRQLEGLQN